MEAKTHFARFMRRGMELARQLHSKEMQRDEFDRAWKKIRRSNRKRNEEKLRKPKSRQAIRKGFEKRVLTRRL